MDPQHWLRDNMSFSSLPFSLDLTTYSLGADSGHWPVFYVFPLISKPNPHSPPEISVRELLKYEKFLAAETPIW
jgi:hypothetical protein